MIPPLRKDKGTSHDDERRRPVPLLEPLPVGLGVPDPAQPEEPTWDLSQRPGDQGTGSPRRVGPPRPDTAGRFSGFGHNPGGHRWHRPLERSATVMVAHMTALTEGGRDASHGRATDRG